MLLHGLLFRCLPTVRALPTQGAHDQLAAAALCVVPLGDERLVADADAAALMCVYGQQ